MEIESSSDTEITNQAQPPAKVYFYRGKLPVYTRNDHQHRAAVVFASLHSGQEVPLTVLALANGAMRYSTGDEINVDGGMMLRQL